MWLARMISLPKFANVRNHERTAPRRVFMTALVLVAVIAIIGAGVGITAFATRRIEAAHPPWCGGFVGVAGGRLHILERGPGGGGGGGAPDRHWPIVLVHGASGN